ncbi:hypothetical protein EVA_20727 [gut metagenome]|uniref:Uncharacterized protein n=1 Tax=gut metagenome TaxID=749906 RepID=J9BUD4_9ZZZZ
MENPRLQAAENGPFRPKNGVLPTPTRNIQKIKRYAYH